MGVGSACAKAVSFGSAEGVGATLEPSGGVWAQGKAHLSDAILSANKVPGGHVAALQRWLMPLAAVWL